MVVLRVLQVGHTERMIRYSRRYHENLMLEKILLTRGVPGLPINRIELYRETHEVCRLRWRGLKTPFDWIALRQIKALARQSY